jgi:hypothetical protein
MNPTQRAVNGTVLFLGGLLVGLTISKFSARQAYDVGLSQGLASVQREAALLKAETNMVCLKYWFDSDESRLIQAKHWMCGKAR